MDKYCVLIPAYQPDMKLVELTAALSDDFFVLIINDGSGDEYDHIFASAKLKGAQVIEHERNKGKGAALKTGLKYLINEGFDHSVITADADGQHSTSDILRVADAMRQNKDTLIIGGRDFSKMPARSKIGNTFARFFFRLATQLHISDTQTGLRGLPPCLFNDLIEVDGDRYEYEMNMLLSIKKWDCAYKEIPISTIYIEGNKSTHFNALRDGLLVFSRVIKYSLSSVGCTLIDFLLYSLLLLWLPTSISYIAARIVSSTVNYQVNRRMVFKAKPSIKSAVAYFSLVIAVMLSGSTLVSLLDSIGWNSILAKIPVDAILFIINYNVQKHLIFKKKA